MISICIPSSVFFRPPRHIQIRNPIQVQLIPQHPRHCLWWCPKLGNFELGDLLAACVARGVRRLTLHGIDREDVVVLELLRLRRGLEQFLDNGVRIDLEVDELRKYTMDLEDAYMRSERHSD